MTGWQPIETAPQDGTEVLVKNAAGHVYVVAYCRPGQVPGYDWLYIDEAEWLRRANGDWDLYDAVLPQSVDAVRWHPIPEDVE